MPPNGFANRPRTPDKSNSNPLGLDTPRERDRDHARASQSDCGRSDLRDWTRSYDDPNVVALREKLNRHNGIKGLEILAPTEVERAVELFYRDGFVVVRDVLGPDQLERMRAAADRALEEMLAVDPTCAAGGGAGGLPHRYSFGEQARRPDT